MFSTVDPILFWKMCEVNVAAEKRFTAQQNIGHDKHLYTVKNASKKRCLQLLLTQIANTSRALHSFS
jgi:hypothetical protein